MELGQRGGGVVGIAVRVVYLFTLCQGLRRSRLREESRGGLMI